MTHPDVDVDYCMELFVNIFAMGVKTEQFGMRGGSLVWQPNTTRELPCCLVHGNGDGFQKNRLVALLHMMATDLGARTGVEERLGAALRRVVAKLAPLGPLQSLWQWALRKRRSWSRRVGVHYERES